MFNIHAIYTMQMCFNGMVYLDRNGQHSGSGGGGNQISAAYCSSRHGYMFKALDSCSDLPIMFIYHQPAKATQQSNLQIFVSDWCLLDPIYMQIFPMLVCRSNKVFWWTYCGGWACSWFRKAYMPYMVSEQSSCLSSQVLTILMQACCAHGQLHCKHPKR